MALRDYVHKAEQWAPGVYDKGSVFDDGGHMWFPQPKVGFGNPHDFPHNYKYVGALPTQVNLQTQRRLPVSPRRLGEGAIDQRALDYDQQRRQAVIRQGRELVKQIDEKNHRDMEEHIYYHGKPSHMSPFSPRDMHYGSQSEQERRKAAQMRKDHEEYQQLMNAGGIRNAAGPPASSSSFLPQVVQEPPRANWDFPGNAFGLVAATSFDNREPNANLYQHNMYMDLYRAPAIESARKARKELAKIGVPYQSPQPDDINKQFYPDHQLTFPNQENKENVRPEQTAPPTNVNVPKEFGSDYNNQTKSFNMSVGQRPPRSARAKGDYNASYRPDDWSRYTNFVGGVEYEMYQDKIEQSYWPALERQIAATRARKKQEALDEILFEEREMDRIVRENTELERRHREEVARENSFKERDPKFMTLKEVTLKKEARVTRRKSEGKDPDKDSTPPQSRKNSNSEVDNQPHVQDSSGGTKPTSNNNNNAGPPYDEAAIKKVTDQPLQRVSDKPTTAAGKTVMKNRENKENMSQWRKDLMQGPPPVSKSLYNDTDPIANAQKVANEIVGVNMLHNDSTMDEIQRLKNEVWRSQAEMKNMAKTCKTKEQLLQQEAMEVQARVNMRITGPITTPFKNGEPLGNSQPLEFDNPKQEAGSAPDLSAELEADIAVVDQELARQDEWNQARLLDMKQLSMDDDQNAETLRLDDDTMNLEDTKQAIPTEENRMSADENDTNSPDEGNRTSADENENENEAQEQDQEQEERSSVRSSKKSAEEAADNNTEGREEEEEETEGGGHESMRSTAKSSVEETEGNRTSAEETEQD